MNNASRKPVFPDKLRGRLTTKQVTDLLILTALLASLLATSTAAFASSRGRDGNGPVQTTSIPNKTSPTRQGASLQQISMQDKTHGWTLAVSSVLKTSDGGQHWKDVTPSTSAITPKKVLWLVGTFMNQNVAWVVGETEEEATIFTQHTIDGGSHWQSALLSGKFDLTAQVIGPPHFINTQEGWLDVRASYGENDLFHTTDGGLHWNIQVTFDQIHQGAAPFSGIDTGISVKDAHNIWETVDPQTSKTAETTPNSPMVFVSHDGAKTWQQQKLPLIPGSTSMRYTTTIPIFFGNYGLMPVKFIPTTISSSTTTSSSTTALAPSFPSVSSAPTIASAAPAPLDSSSSNKSHLSIYVTNDGGVHWSSSAQTPFEIENYGVWETEQVDILDRQHIWVESPDGSIHASQDGGKSWNTLASIGGNPVPALRGMSFTDPNTGWITIWNKVTNPNGTSQLSQTIDGGRTWQPIPYSIQ